MRGSKCGFCILANLKIQFPGQPVRRRNSPEEVKALAQFSKGRIAVVGQTCISHSRV